MRRGKSWPTAEWLALLQAPAFQARVHDDLTHSSVFIHDGCYTLPDFVYLWPGPGPDQAKIIVLLHILHYFTMPSLQVGHHKLVKKGESLEKKATVGILCLCKATQQSQWTSRGNLSECGVFSNKNRENLSYKKGCKHQHQANSTNTVSYVVVGQRIRSRKL